MDFIRIICVIILSVNADKSLQKNKYIKIEKQQLIYKMSGTQYKSLKIFSRIKHSATAASPLIV